MKALLINHKYMDTNEFEYDGYFGDRYNARKRLKQKSKVGVVLLFVVVIIAMYFATKALDSATDKYINYQVQKQLNK